MGNDAAVAAARADLLKALSALPDEAFSYVAAWAGGFGAVQFPDGIGGFMPAAQVAITNLRKAAAAYIAAQTDAHRSEHGA